MNVNYYRQLNASGEEESWQNCQFTGKTDLSGLTVKPIVTINGQEFLRQHHVTYLTGKETCRAHHFAKLLATKVLDSGTKANGCKVLWIDTLHGPHICSRIYHELVQHAHIKENLHFVCLDILGSHRDNFHMINQNVAALIKKFNPELVVIDDIDHFMPFCGVNIAIDFCRIVRDVTNHSDTAFLFIGYNHLHKKASTTGNLGKYLFLNASDVFSLSTQHDVTTVRLVISYDLSKRPDDHEYRFTIAEDNLPQEAERSSKCKAIDDDTTLEDVTDNQQKPQSLNRLTKTINNPLTLPPLPQCTSGLPNGDAVKTGQATVLKKDAACPVDRGTASVIPVIQLQ